VGSRRVLPASTLLLILIILIPQGFFPVTPVMGVTTTWSTGTSLTPLGSIEDKPYVTQDSQGNLWLAYESSRSGNWDIYLRTFNGVSWSVEQRLTTDTAYDLDPALVQLAHGGVMLVWASNKTGNFSLYYKTNTAGVWSNQYTITSGPVRDSSPSLLQLRNGTLLLFWGRETLSGTVVRNLYYKSYNNGVWSPENQFTSDGSELQPSLLQSSDGTIWATYAALRGGVFGVYYKTLKTSWSSEIPLTTTDDRMPWLMEDLNGTMWTFWTRCVVVSISACEDDVFYKTSTDLGSSWSPEVRFTIPPTGYVIDSNHPTAINAPDKKIYLFWATDLTGLGADFDVYVSTSSPIPIHDLAVTFVGTSPDKPRSGESMGITVRVGNLGDYTENALLNVTIDGTKIGSASTVLAAGQNLPFYYTWNSTGKALGVHQLQSVVANVSGEVRTWNNVVTSKFFVLSPGDVNRDGFVNFLDLALVGNSFLTKVGDPMYNPQADLRHAGFVAFQDLAIVGSTFGTSIILPPDFYLNPSQYYLKVGQGSSLNVSISTTGINGQKSPLTLSASGFGSGVTAIFSLNPVSLPGTSTLTLTTSPTATAGRYNVFVTGNNGTVTRFVNFTLAVLPLHDVAVLGMTVSRSFAYAGISANPVKINVTASNLGSGPGSETFNVTLLANTTQIGRQLITLGAGASLVVTFSLNTTLLVRGNYTLTARASPVMGETNLSNNIVTGGNVYTVKLAGDVNGDCAVNFLDLGRIGSAFLTTIGHTGYDPQADLNNDGAINFIDLGVVGSNFLKKCA